MSAAFFFNKNKLWDICDKGHTHDVVVAVTKRVNGGTIGLADRQKHFDSFHSLMA
jgi:putative chitinase